MTSKSPLLLVLLLFTASVYADSGDNDCPCIHDCDIYQKFYAFLDSVDGYHLEEGYRLLSVAPVEEAHAQMTQSLAEAYDFKRAHNEPFEEFVRTLRMEAGRLHLDWVEVVKETPEFFIYFTFSPSGIEEGMVEIRAPYKRIYFRNIEHYEYNGSKYAGAHKTLELAINPKFTAGGKPVRESYRYHVLAFHNGVAYIDRPNDSRRWRESFRKTFFLGHAKKPRIQDLAAHRGMCMQLCYTPGQTILPLQPLQPLQASID